MSVSRAAKLILTLVDRVSVPAKAITTALTGVNTAVSAAGRMAMAPAAALTNTARNFRRSAGDFTVAGGAVAMGLGLAGKAIYDMEDTLNEIEGRRFGKRDVFNLANGTEMTREAFRKSVADLIAEINRTSPRHAGEIAKAYNQLVQAGLTHEQVEGVLPIAIDFAIAGNYDTEEAADKLTNVMTAMRLPMATMKEANESALRAADVISYASNETNSSVEQMTEAFKYAAPSASALGVSIEQLAAMFLIQARRGIKASEAGVSIRAMLTRMVRPTKMAREALGRYNIDLADYLEKSKEITAGDVSNALQFGGLDARGAEAEVQKILDSSAKTGQKVQQITAAVMKAVGDQTTMSAEQISTSVNEILFGFGESLDVERLISDMQAAGIAMSDFFQIFDVRQGARTLALFGDDFSAWVEKLQQSSAGFAEALRETRMQGVVGAVARFSAAMIDLFRAAADSGVLDTVTSAIERLAAAINHLKDIDPNLLKIGTYGLMAAAALVPLGFAMSGVAAAAGLLINPLTWVAAAVGYLAYLNWEGITSYVKSFGAALSENLGPRTAHYLERAKELLADIFTTHDWDAAGAGADHGSWVAKFLESTIVVTEEIVSWVSSIPGKLQAAWGAFEAWWDYGVLITNTKAREWAAAVKAGFTWLTDGSSDQWLKDTFVAGWNGALAGMASALDAFVNSQFATTFATAGSVLYQAGAAMIQSLWDGAVAKFNEFVGWLTSIPGRIRDAIGRIDLSNIIRWPSLPSWMGGGGGEPEAPAPKPRVDGARASGGPVKAGLTYKVGENGIEMFTPAVNGSITPNHKLGGGGVPQVVFNNRLVLNGGATEKQAADIFRELERQLTRSAQIIFGSGNTYGEA